MTQRPDTHDMVQQLTRTHVLVERITTTDGTTTTTQPHFVKAPALLEQLGNTDPMASDNDRAGSGYKSRPTVNMEALDTLIHIDLAAARWLRDLGQDDPGSTTACVTKLGSLLPSCTPTQRAAIETDIRSWWARARVASGWDSPAWKPANTCPLCAERGTLRIRLADHTGYCVNCESTWDPTTIGLLADHIRVENGEDLAS